jgi:hypothetical protein
MKRTAFLILTLLAWCPALGAKTIDLDSATIADIDDAFKAGTLTSERLVQLCLARNTRLRSRRTIASRGHDPEP